MPDLKQWKDSQPSDFLVKQLEFPRVRTAHENKLNALKIMLLKKGITSFENELFLRVFKIEEKLEVWLKPKDKKQYQLVHEYDFCKNSGTPGPKRREGDRQIPEGFYRVSHFNPKSNFLLSLKVNYPNKSDILLSDPDQPGGDIYIHGGCQTVGCVPLTDDKIEELYLLAVLSKQENTPIPIHVFPCEMIDSKLEPLFTKYPKNRRFWQDLKAGYIAFENNKILPKIEFLPDGSIVIGH